MDYEVHVTGREGRWWAIEIPALGGITQAVRLADVESEARNYIAVTLDVAPQRWMFASSWTTHDMPATCRNDQSESRCPRAGPNHRSQGRKRNRCASSRTSAGRCPDPRYRHSHRGEFPTRQPTRE